MSNSIGIEKIYVDMDGVICNFNKKYIEMFGSAPDSKESRKNFSENFKELIEKRGFADLDPMSDASLLLTYLNTLKHIPKEILSSTAREEHHDAISKQKSEWLKKHNIDFKQNFVPGKRHKAKFATPNSIIIDDTLSVINDWDKAGGIGVLHKNAVSTIAILSLYV